MAKFKKALALVLSLAMVLTLAPVANVNAAAKYKISAKTTALAAGKTYNVKVTGVTKNQYVKVARTSGLTVKYSGKTIKASKKVAGTGKALTFKVTANGKEKAYNATIKVNIFNKKTNKKVKTLSTKRKIKALPVQELSLESVESAVEVAPGGDTKYLVVKFNKKMTSLSPSDIEIRDVDTDQLYSVSKVTLASDGMSAQVEILGDQGTSTSIVFITPLRKYNFKVIQNGKVAAKDFVVPVTAPNVVVTAMNLSKKTLTISGGVGIIDASQIKNDYFELLGETVTAKFDNEKLISVKPTDQKVVYGSFKTAKTANGDNSITLTNVFDKDESYNTAVNAAGTASVAVANTYANAGYSVGTGATLVATNTTYEYAKLIINGGAVSRVYYFAPGFATNTTMLVSKVDGNVVTGATGASADLKAERNFKDYTVIKDNKLASLADVKENDTLFYNTAANNQYVIVKTNSSETTVDASYTTKVVIGGKEYTWADITDSTVYMDGKLVSTITTGDGEATFNKLKTGGKVNVYLNLAGAIAYVTGTAGAAKTNTAQYILTKKFGMYTGAQNVPYLYATLTDGTNELKLDVPVSQITSITGVKDTVNATTGGSLTWTAGAAATARGELKGNATQALKALGTDNGSGTFNATAARIGLMAKAWTDGAAATAGDQSINLTSWSLGSLVNVTTDDKNNVVGLEVFNKAADSTVATALAANLDLATNPSAGGKTTSATTPVFVITDATTAGTPDKVAKTTLGDCTYKTKGTVANAYATYDAGKSTANAIVLFTSDLTNAGATVVKTETVIVVDAKFETDGTTQYLKKLDVIKTPNGEAFSYEKFDENKSTDTVKTYVPSTQATGTTAWSTIANGDILDVGLDAQGSVVAAGTTRVSEAITITAPSANTGNSTAITLGGTPYEKKEGSVIFKKTDSNSYEVETWADATTPSNCKTITAANYSGYQNVANTVGVLVITYNPTVAAAAADTADIATAKSGLPAFLTKATATTLTLPAATNGTTFTWSSNNTAVLSNAGVFVTNGTAELTVTITKGTGTTATQKWTITSSGGAIETTDLSANVAALTALPATVATLADVAQGAYAGTAVSNANASAQVLAKYQATAAVTAISGATCTVKTAGTVDVTQGSSSTTLDAGDTVASTVITVTLAGGSKKDVTITSATFA